MQAIIGKHRQGASRRGSLGPTFTLRIDLKSPKIPKIAKNQICWKIALCTTLEIAESQLSSGVRKLALCWLGADFNIESKVVRARQLGFYLVTLFKSVFEMRSVKVGPNELKFGPRTFLPKVNVWLDVLLEIRKLSKIQPP